MTSAMFLRGIPLFEVMISVATMRCLIVFVLMESDIGRGLASIVGEMAIHSVLEVTNRT